MIAPVLNALSWRMSVSVMMGLRKLGKMEVGAEVTIIVIFHETLQCLIYCRY